MKNFLIPSKTFILGEYSTLFQGPALVAAMNPYFEVVFQRSEVPQNNPFHEKSPAGLFYQKNFEQLSQWKLEFKDPYNGGGGFGASTAQFLALYHFQNPKVDPYQMLSEYREICRWNQGVLPSGADLMTQFQGGLTYFNSEMKHLQKLDWKFRNLNIHFLATGIKLATHEHLQTLQKFSVEVLKESTLKAVAALQMISENDFLEAVREFGAELKNLELVATHTQKLIEAAEQCDFILASKGCGAMGSDTLLLVTEKSTFADEKVLEFAREHQIQKISDLSQLGQGIHTSESPT